MGAFGDIFGGIGDMIGARRGRKGGDKAYSNFQRGSMSQLEDVPQYQGSQYQAAPAYQGADYVPGQYAGAQDQAGYVNALREGLGVQGPAQIYDAMQGAYMADMTSALNAAGSSGMRGGVGVANNEDALRRSGAVQGLAGLAGQQAQAQQNYDQFGQQLGQNYATQLGGYNLGRGGQSQQAANAYNTYGQNQAGAQNAFNQNEALRAYAGDVGAYDMNQQTLVNLYNARMGNAAVQSQAAQMFGGGMGGVADGGASLAMMAMGGGAGGMMPLGGAQQAYAMPQQQPLNPSAMGNPYQSPIGGY